MAADEEGKGGGSSGAGAPRVPRVATPAPAAPGFNPNLWKRGGAAALKTPGPPRAAPRVPTPVAAPPELAASPPAPPAQPVAEPPVPPPQPSVAVAVPNVPVPPQIALAPDPIAIAVPPKEPDPPPAPATSPTASSIVLDDSPPDVDPDATAVLPRSDNRKAKMIVAGVVGFALLILVIAGIRSLVSSKPKAEVADKGSETTEETPTPKKKKSADETVTKTASSGTTTASAPPGASAAPASATADGALPKGFGWLTAHGPEGKVVIAGKVYGDSGTKLAVPCGYRWVLIAQMDAKGKIAKPLTKSQSTFIKCGEAVEVTLKK